MPAQAAAAENESESILDTVTQAYEALEAADDETDASDTDTTTTESVGDEEIATDTTIEGDAEEVSADAGSDDTLAADTDTSAGDDETASTTTAPEHWSDDDKTMFAAQTPQAQEYLLRRHSEMEADYTRKTQENAEIINEYEPVKAIMTPFKQSMAAMGLTEADVIRRWAAAESSLNSNPVAAIKQLAQVYKVDLTQLNGSQPEGADPYFNGNEQTEDPRVTELSQTVQSMASTMQNEALTRANQQIDAFKNTKTDDGVPRYPHFDELKPAITQLAQMKRQVGEAIDLVELYETAVWANPTTRQKLLDSQHTAESEAAKAKEAERLRLQKEKAAKAKAAASSVRSSTDVGAAPGGVDNKNSTLRQDVEAAYERASDTI